MRFTFKPNLNQLVVTDSNFYVAQAEVPTF